MHIPVSQFDQPVPPGILKQLSAYQEEKHHKIVLQYKSQFTIQLQNILSKQIVQNQMLKEIEQQVKRIFLVDNNAHRYKQLFSCVLNLPQRTGFASFISETGSNNMIFIQELYHLLHRLQLNHNMTIQEFTA